MAGAQRVEGVEILEYVVKTLPEGPVVTVEAKETAATITELGNGQSYKFTVTAKSAKGLGAESIQSNLTTTPNVPDAPRGVAAQGGVGSATVSWVEPKTNGSPIAGYTVTVNPGGMTVAVDGTATSAEITGLTPGVYYSFVVTATNAVGSGAPSSDAAAAIPHSVPSAPTRLAVTRGDRQLNVRWFRPSNDGGSPITGYRVTASPGGATTSVDVGVTSAIVTGLTNGTPYTFVVVALNAVGESAPSEPSEAVDPATVPEAPTAVSALTALRREAKIPWTAPTSTGGIPLTGYRIASNPGGYGLVVAPTETTATVAGLQNGTAYTFTVVALNEVGANSSPRPPIP